MSDKQILKNPKIRYEMSIDTTGLKMNEPIKFDKYSNLSDKEFVEKVRSKAKNFKYYTTEHIDEVFKGKLNTNFPNNLIQAPGRMGSQVQAIKEYLRKNPNGQFAKQADEVLKQTGMQFKTGGKTFGVKENIVFNSKTNKSNIVENYFKPKPSMIKGAFKAIKPVLKAVPLVGTAIGVYDVGKAVQAGITDPRDLFAAYQVSADVAAKNKLMREDPEFRQKELAGLPAIETEDFTSYFNGGIVAVKGVK